MPLIRGHHEFDDNYTQIPNAWLRDKRLSLGARGLLAQLLSHRPGWSVSQDRLAAANNCGRDKVRRHIQELMAAGYLARSDVQQHDDAGRLAGYDYVTVDPPLYDFPTKGNPTQGNHTAKNTISKNTINLEVTASAVNAAFDEFWGTYPNRLGKGEARRAFAKAVEQVGVQRVLDGVRRLAADPNLPPRQYVPRAATWLNQERWDDDPYPAREPVHAQRPAAEGPGRRDWVQALHESGEHFECMPGEFG